MIFRDFKENDGWVTIDYTTTWKYGYDFMLDAAQTIIDIDFGERLQRLGIAEIAGAESTEKLEEVRKVNNILRDCDDVKKECGVLIASGISNIMQCPVQFVFFNQTNYVKLMSPAGEYFKANGEHVFDNYVNSIEIKAYCKETERETMEKMKEK